MATKKKKTEVNTKDNILLEQTETKEIKKELESYIDERINKVFIDELDKANRRLIREKSRKILFKNIAIVILLAIIGFLVYILYTNNYFDKFFNKNESEIAEKEKKEETKKDNEKKEEIKKEPTLNELKTKYASLLDKYVIYDEAEYLEDFYNGNLTNDLKKYMALNVINPKSIRTEVDYQIIDGKELELTYLELFNGNYTNSSFDYNGNKLKYVVVINSYITSELIKNEISTIKREIIDIKVSDNKVMITTVEGKISGNKLYNIISNNEIENYNGDNILKYSDSLNKITYVFQDNKLIDLVK